MLNASSSRRRFTSIAAGVALAAGLALAPAAAAQAAGVYQQVTRDTQAQCQWEQSQWRKAGYYIAYSCYYAAGKWMFVAKIG